MRVDPSNVEQLRVWDGEAGAFWVDRAERFDEGVAAYHGTLLDAAEISSDSTVLDIGCGSGRTTRDAARIAAAGSVLGVDLSSRMIELARRSAECEHLANVAFEQVDAQVYPFPEEAFDVAISRSGAMFFGRPSTAFANIARTLRADGRLVLLAWQPLERNEWISTFRDALSAGRDLPEPSSDEPGPFSLSDPNRVRALLNSSGFWNVGMRGIEEPMYFGADPEDAYRFVAEQFAWMLEGLDGDARASALENLRSVLVEHHTERGVLLGSAAWLIEARRR